MTFTAWINKYVNQLSSDFLCLKFADVIQRVRGHLNEDKQVNDIYCSSKQMSQSIIFGIYI